MNSRERLLNVISGKAVDRRGWTCDIDCIEAITPLPTGDVKISEIRNTLGKDAILIGGIDATVFTYYSPYQIESMLDELLYDIGSDLNIILGSEEVPASADYYKV